MKSILSVVLLFVTGFCISCDVKNSDNKESNNRILAKVGNKILTETDLENYIFISSSEDSIMYNARKEHFVKQWVQDQLLFEIAMSEKVIPTEKLNRMIDDYVKQLVLSAYKKNLFVKDSSDVSISDIEVSNFYSSNENDFKLEDYLVEGAYVSYPKANTSQMQPILRKIAMGGEQNYKDALEMCSKITEFKVDIKPILFLTADKVRVYFPRYANLQSVKGYAKLEDVSDDMYSALYVKSVWNKGETAPLEYHRDNIKELLKYQKKKKYIDDLERRIYVDAVKNKKAEIYDN
ncbi:MAG: hypothetical protein ACK5IQ_03205 [Bacteroidales bacterium]